VGTPGVVALAPTLDEHLRFEQRVELLASQKFVPQLAFKALDVAILSRAAWLDVKRGHPHAGQPLANLGGHELRTIVAPQVLRHAAADEQVAQPFQYIFAAELASHVDR